MHNPDDQFEAHLKRFQPLIPDPLPVLEHTRAVRRLAVWIAVVAVMAAVGVLVLRIHKPEVVSPVVTVSDSSNVRPSVRPLTQRNANEWLARSPSFKTAVDRLEVRSESNLIQPGKQSAVAALSELRIRL